MNNNGKVIGIFLAGLVLLPGCVHVPSYKPKSLDSIKSFNPLFTHKETKHNVTLGVNYLNDNAKFHLFNDRNILLDGEKVEIIHISVYNLSTDQYVISPNGIGAIQIPYTNVLRSLQTSSTDHLKKAGVVGGAIYGTLSGLTIAMFLPMGFYIIITGTMLVAWPIVATITMLPFLGKTIKSTIMNGCIDKDLKEKMLHREVIIPSGEKYEGLIFVKSSDYNPQFNVALTEQYHPDNKLIFDVDLSSTDI